jgi:hypothetical protein
MNMTSFILEFVTAQRSKVGRSRRVKTGWAKCREGTDKE